MSDLDLLAYSRLLERYRALLMTAAGDRAGADSATRPPDLPDLAKAVRTGPLSTVARSTVALALDPMRARSILIKTPVPDLDDAIDYIDIVRVEDLRPTLACSTLAEVIDWYRSPSGLGAADSPKAQEARATAQARAVLEKIRHHQLHQHSSEDHRTLRRFLGFPVAERARAVSRKVIRGQLMGTRREYANGQIDDIVHARLMLTATFIHGLHYEIAPDELLSTISDDRIGRIAQQARTRLRHYRHARHAMGLRGLPHRARTLARELEHPAPTTTR